MWSDEKCNELNTLTRMVWAWIFFNTFAKKKLSSAEVAVGLRLDLSTIFAHSQCTHCGFWVLQLANLRAHSAIRHNLSPVNQQSIYTLSSQTVVKQQYQDIVGIFAYTIDGGSNIIQIIYAKSNAFLCALIYIWILTGNSVITLTMVWNINCLFNIWSVNVMGILNDVRVGLRSSIDIVVMGNCFH